MSDHNDEYIQYSQLTMTTPAYELLSCMTIHCSLLSEISRSKSGQGEEVRAIRSTKLFRKPELTLMTPCLSFYQCRRHRGMPVSSGMPQQERTRHYCS